VSLKLNGILMAVSIWWTGLWDWTVGLDCGTGLWNWTQRKLRYSFPVTETIQEIYSFQLTEDASF